MSNWSYDNAVKKLATFTTCDATHKNFNPALRDSIIRNIRFDNGDGGAIEAVKEASSPNSHGTIFNCSGNKQCGYGEFNFPKEEKDGWKRTSRGWVKK